MTFGRTARHSALTSSACLAIVSSSFGGMDALAPDERDRVQTLGASLRAPTHTVDFAYYGAEWKGLDFRAEVREFTTVDMVRAIHYTVVDGDDSEWTRLLARSLTEAVE